MSLIAHLCSHSQWKSQLYAHKHHKPFERGYIFIVIKNSMPRLYSIRWNFGSLISKNSCLAEIQTEYFHITISLMCFTLLVFSTGIFTFQCIRALAGYSTLFPVNCCPETFGYTCHISWCAVPLVISSLYWTLV